MECDDKKEKEKKSIAISPFLFTKSTVETPNFKKSFIEEGH